MPDNRILDIVDEDDNVIGQATREKIHAKGLLHREIHVWLYNKEGELFFQMRDKNKETFPGLLDASIGGHVEMGDSYEKTALKEAEEETGLEIDPHKLKIITTVKNVAHDSITGKINNAIRKVYAYEFNGSSNDLRIEEGKATGFEAVKIDSLFTMSAEEKQRFIPIVFEEVNLDVFRKIKALLSA
jgi:isopentenyldiphosphate isomerase